MSLLFNTLDSTTRPHRIPKLVDNFFEDHPLLDKLLKRGNVINGGTEVEQPIQYDLQGAGGTWSGAQVLRSEIKEFITQVKLTWAKYYVTITFTDDEDRANRGANRVLRLIKLKEQNAFDHLRKNMSFGIFDDGTKVYDAASGEANGFTGLLKIISDTAATYGAVAEADCSVWVPQRADATTAQLSIPRMLSMLMLSKNGSDMSDLIITTEALWQKYWALLAPAQRGTMGDRVGKWGFRALEFMGIPVVDDADCPAGKMYFINSKYLNLLYAEGDNFSKTPYGYPVNQPHIRMSRLAYVGNILCTQRRRQGVIFNLSES